MNIIIGMKLLVLVFTISTSVCGALIVFELLFFGTEVFFLVSSLLVLLATGVGVSLVFF